MKVLLHLLKTPMLPNFAFKFEKLEKFYWGCIIFLDKPYILHKTIFKPLNIFCSIFIILAQVNLHDHILIKGGGLKGPYRASQFHFHWGSRSDRGSEHIIDTKRYPMEVNK